MAHAPRAGLSLKPVEANNTHDRASLPRAVWPDARGANRSAPAATNNTRYEPPPLDITSVGEFVAMVVV